jgi:hypothetical protein
MANYSRNTLYMHEKVRSNGGMILTGENRNTEGEKTLSQGHLFHHECHMNWPGIEPWPAATDRPLTASLVTRHIVI